MKIINVVGTRPNFMKVAPIYRAFQQYPHFDFQIVHTGQHYDKEMSEVFFKQLELPTPDHYLGIGGGTHAEVTGRIMIEFEKILRLEQPALVIVVGDVNSTLACAITAKKLNIPLAHVEAGLRSGDRQMPEELNRILTDSIADYLFVSESSGLHHLAREGIKKENIFFVGNVMIDTLVRLQPKADTLTVLPKLNLQAKDYVLLTMHRPANVDSSTSLTKLIEIVEQVCSLRPIIFPIHPRTKKRLQQSNLLKKLEAIPNLKLLPPQGYLEFLYLMKNAACIITDSGGIQEESTYLQVPCLTIRDTTERPVTLNLGTNILITKLDVEAVMVNFNRIIEGRLNSQPVIPPLWDGKTAERIVQIIDNQLYHTTIL